jgi:hypothetical protein
VALKIRKGDDGAILCGDVLHHPIQIYRPEMYSLAVVDIALETATRERILTECAEHDLLMLPAHFAAPHAAYVRSAHRGFEIDFSRMRQNIS